MELAELPVSLGSPNQAVPARIANDATFCPPRNSRFRPGLLTLGSMARNRRHFGPVVDADASVVDADRRVFDPAAWLVLRHTRPGPLGRSIDRSGTSINAGWIPRHTP